MSVRVSESVCVCECGCACVCVCVCVCVCDRDKLSTYVSTYTHISRTCIYCTKYTTQLQAILTSHTHIYNTVESTYIHAQHIEWLLEGTVPRSVERERGRGWGTYGASGRGCREGSGPECPHCPLRVCPHLCWGCPPGNLPCAGGGR